MTGRLIAAVLVLLGTTWAQAQTQSAEVMRARSAESGPSHFSASASFVSVRELGVPSSAAKEFEKADHLVAKREWAKAAERLQKGLSIYPQSAVGYNNLGATYAHLGNNAQAREALQQAIALDDRLAPAYVNLGRISFLEKDYVGVESLLTRANSLAPAPNADELFLLAYAQLSNQHLDEAILTSRQAHEGNFRGHGFLHLVAASAYDRMSRAADSRAELEMLLKEEPNGPQAEQVRKTLERIQAQATTH